MMWFRNDLRLADNPALHAAVKRGAILPLFINESHPEAWRPGAASRWWVSHSLAALDESLRTKGGGLTILSGDPAEVLARLAKEHGVDTVYWNTRFEPHLFALDQEIRRLLKQQGIQVQTFNASLLFDPARVLNKQGKPYRVFTPYWRSCSSAIDVPAPMPVPRKIDFIPVSGGESSERLDEKWAAEFRAFWRPGEVGARKKLRRFLDSAAADYAVGRDRPDWMGTSRLSPHLHFGEISLRAVWHAVQASDESGVIQNGEAFLRQLGWREFAHHLLWHYPHTMNQPLREQYAHFPWQENRAFLSAWQQGRTGFPLVDAGMRELWATGWMHNRVRMIVASFLVKDLLIPWQEGARWFWDTLVDADLANNTSGWQWVAGCGADASPYFRVFNPITQGAKFDPKGDYIRRWVPELAPLPNKYLNRPWEAPAELLASCGIQLGQTYPLPMVDHAQARLEALAAYASIKAI